MSETCIICGCDVCGCDAIYVRANTGRAAVCSDRCYKTYSIRENIEAAGQV